MSDIVLDDDMELGSMPLEGARGVELVWNDITYTVQNGAPCRRSSRRILHSCSGAVQSGQFLAIMGSSGAGKTSLLNALANRLPSSAVSGTVLVNGHPATTKRMKKCSAYVLQDDVLLPLVSVRETVRYAALLRLPSSMSEKKKFRKVDDMLEMLGLTKVRHSKIKDLSGGERKRTSIAVELITSPGLLFLDEPTSGLDSCTALSLVETLKSLSQQYGYTIVCTIHQPRSRIFARFDLLLNMAQGEVIYLGRADEALAYYASLGYECPTHENPADYFIDLTTVDPKAKQECEERTSQLIKSYSHEPFASKIDSDVLHEKGTYLRSTAPFHTQFLWLFDRAVRSNLRNIQMIITRSIQTLLIAVVIGMLFFQLDDDQVSINDRSGLLVITIINNSFNELFAVLLTFLPEQEVVKRERASGTYTSLSYFLAKMLADLPFQILYPGLFCCIVYWMAGLQPDALKFMAFMSTVWCTAFVANSIGLIIAVILPPEPAAAIGPLSMVVSLIFSGFFVTIDSIPVFLRWISWLVFMRYGWSSLMVLEFEDLDLTCESDQFVTIAAGNTTIQQCPFTKGEDVIDARDVVDMEPYQMMLIMVGMVILFRTFAYFLLKWAKRP